MSSGTTGNGMVQGKSQDIIFPGALWKILASTKDNSRNTLFICEIRRAAS